MIEIVPYDVAWPRQYELEAENLRVALGPLALRIEHVGSTSIPGLEAKAVIDIQITVATLATLSPYAGVLADLGYRHVPDADFDTIYPFFQKPSIWPSTHHIHLCVPGADIERQTLVFRDYLRAHPEIAAQYVELKKRLAAMHGGATAESREQYSHAKSAFIMSVLERALGTAGKGL